MSEAPLTTRSVQVDDARWGGLAMVAGLRHTSLSQVIRDAIDHELARYGLTVQQDELIPVMALWPEELIAAGRSRGAKIQGGGGSTGIQPGGESSGGDPTAQSTAEETA